MKKRGLIVRHVPYEGLAGFREPIEAAGYELERIDVCGPSFGAADLVTPDLVILMGGPMGIYDRHAHPWIPHEMERLAERLEEDRPTLGVCLGAQMIAAALGADVYAGPQKEICFAPLILTDDAHRTPLSYLAEVPVLHWHGDTFDLPAGTERLASTALTPNQAFRRGANILALQFHAEMGLDTRIEDWIDQSPNCLAKLGRSGAEIRRSYNEYGPLSVAAGRYMIAAWLEQLEA